MRQNNLPHAGRSSCVDGPQCLTFCAISMMKRAASVTLACALLATAGCSARKASSGENYYVKATDEYSQHYYEPAIDDYQKLIDEYPFSPYAEEAELNIGLAYYKSHNYAEAIGTFNDFLRMHPTSKHLDIASYYLARSHFDQIGRPDQDQTHTQLALEQFESIERRFPESNFASLAQEDVEICREMLARHEYLIGQFYTRRANFSAAESRMAELLALYPDTPVAPEALEQLGETLEKQGKKYSAAQAFTALKQHFPHTQYAAEADHELKRLNQPVDTEEDPLKLVLAEIGYGQDQPDQNVAVHESLANLSSSETGGNGNIGADGLPIMPAATASKGSNSTIGSQPSQPNPGPATLNTIRLSSSDPPLSVIFDLSGPVTYDQHLDNGDGSSSLTLYLKQVTPSASVPSHVVFDRSIFHDCDVASDSGGTKVTINLTQVSRYVVLPIQTPPRLLVTFTPAASNTASSEPGFSPN